MRRRATSRVDLPVWCLDFYTWQVEQPAGDMLRQYLAWCRLAADYIDQHAPGLSLDDLAVEADRRRAAA